MNTSVYRVRIGLAAVLCFFGMAAVGIAAAAPPAEMRLPADDVRPVLGCGKAHAMALRHADEHMREGWRAEYQAMLAKGLREAFEDTDLLSCDLELEIIPSLYDNLSGVNVMTIESKVDGLTQFTFRLHDQYTISSILIGGATPVSFTTPSYTTRVVTLDRVYDEGEVFTLTVTYAGHADSGGYGSIEFTTHSGTDIVFTLSEPYLSYTWWPVKDGDHGEPGDNSDKFLADVAVISPDWMVTASNGVLQGIDTLSGSRHRYRWSSSYPICPYLVCFSSTNYETWSQTYVPLAGGTMPVDFYIYPEHNSAGNRAAWNKAVDMLYTMRDLFGEYPFVDEKYGIYECEFGGGMEHQTFTAQGGFSESLTAHELAHQWWGDMVTCKTWNHIWLNEGFASYTEALWAEFKPGSSGLPALKSTMSPKKYTGSGSVYVTNGELNSMSSIFDWYTTYNKAAWVVHMLRHVLGDASFFDALAAYRTAFEFSAATTEDLQAVCEGFYPGGDLGWFFQEWVYGQRTPAYRHGWQNANVNGQDYLLLYIDQYQSASYQRFTMPIDIVVDGTTYVVFNDNDPEHFVIPLPAPAGSVQLDPDEWILTSSRSTTSYVAGPPTVVETAPAPGATHELADAVDEVAIIFHTDVNTVSGNYTLVGDSGGSQTVAFAYDSGTSTTTLTASGTLAPDTYTLTVDDALTAADSGNLLDGDVIDALALDSLPSGDGVEGGDAVIKFTIICAFGDADCD
ncbi:MAG: hypothetical protein GY842_11710, partial [bacterium]|nr:hypothetical protein [bacterium]